jgi:hypothetical protein
VSYVPGWREILHQEGSMLEFQPPNGWVGKIEIQANVEQKKSSV